MMKIGMLSCFVVLFLVCSTHVDAREWIKPMFMDQDEAGNKISYMEGFSPDSVCDSCLDVSRKAEKMLSDPTLFEEISTLSGQVCRTLPSDFEVKCLETSGAYLDQTRFFLKDLFHEEALCNNTRLCLDKSVPRMDNNLFSVNWIFEELTDERACDSCRRSAKDILTQFQQSKLRTKVMDALLEYCEEVDENAERCRETIYKYAPVVFSKLNKMRPNDMCRLIGICDEGISVV